MKYDPHTKRVERDPSDKERHRQIRDRLRFPQTPTIAEVEVAVDALVEDGLLSPEPAHEAVDVVASALRTERERQGLSLAELAQRTGLEESTLSDLETGHRPIASLQTIMNWAKALGKRLELRLVDG